MTSKTWPTKKLGELLQDRDSERVGKTVKIKKNDYQDSGRCPVVDQGVNLISGYIDDESKLYKGKLPVVIFGDHTRIFKFIDFKFAIGADGTKILQPNKELLVPKYFYYALLNLRIENLGYKRHFSVLRRKNIDLPPLKIQHKIVGRLDAVKQAQELNDKQITLTDELFQSLLNKELASKTNRWEVRKMKEICIKITDGTHKTPKYVKEGIHFISTVNLVPFANNFDFSSYEKYISVDEHNELIKRAKPEKGDILISKCGTIGRTQLIRVDYDFSIFVGLMLVKVNRKLVIPEYIECYLNQPNINSELENLSTGASRLTLTIDALKSFKIFIPPLETQRQIVEKLQATQDYKKKLLEQNQKLQELFESCLDKAMKGEL